MYLTSSNCCRFAAISYSYPSNISRMFENRADFVGPNQVVISGVGKVLITGPDLSQSVVTTIPTICLFVKETMRRRDHDVFRNEGTTTIMLPDPGPILIELFTKRDHPRVLKSNHPDLVP